MIYATTSTTITPGQRFAAIDHLKTLAGMMRENHGVESMVLTPVSGASYRVHVVTKYDSLAHAEEVQAALRHDESFGDWWAQADGMYDWAGTTVYHYRVE